jgi:signal transduction histidine kinase
MMLVGKQVEKMVKRFEVDVEADLPPVVANEGKIEQVLINLIINAGQAADKLDSWVKVAGRRVENARQVELVVEDNGCGIPEEIIDRIFDPFFTTKGRDAGTGLGLSISQRIVEEHGGKLSVSSRAGEGSRFVILLPAGEDLDGARA